MRMTAVSVNSGTTDEYASDVVFFLHKVNDIKKFKFKFRDI